MAGTTERDAIAAYFDAYRTLDLEGLRALLKKDLRHSSPFGEWTDRDAMLGAIWPSVTGKVYATRLEIFGEGPDYLVRYEHGGGSNARIAEYFRFDDGLIAEIEVYFGKGSLPPPSA